MEEAKKQVLQQLQENAKTFAGQLKEHLQAATTRAEQEKATISQAFKKRKAGQQDAPGEPGAGGGAAAAKPDPAGPTAGATAARAASAEAGAAAENYLQKMREQAAAAQAHAEEEF